ncbi:hypothetical protein E2C01_074672 [Portunus trituberculatus]|uniref:Uncharacterized protein n=1 Tax=Portunus trituberculatus TaxID=210409 RepID=A0A5B7ID29_PORTR|nr:hypothetical protein [Portunus trituberculatus]
MGVEVRVTRQGVGVRGGRGGRCVGACQGAHNPSLSLSLSPTLGRYGLTSGPVPRPAPPRPAPPRDSPGGVGGRDAHNRYP